MQTHCAQRTSPGDFLGDAAAGLAAHNVSLFLDIDGTLLELAETPDAVLVEPTVIDLLRQLARCCDGAIALVSGRSIAVLDELFRPLLLPAAGLHGFEQRSAAGIYCRREPPSRDVLERVRRLLMQVAARYPALLVEDKHYSLALHYRQAPELEQTVLADAAAIARLAGPQLHLQRGRMVIELRPACASKAAAVAEFMSEPPFRGRVPVYFGDDLTDECAFEWVNAVGGISVAVNVDRTTVARQRLPSVTEARACLASFVVPQGGEAT